MPVKLSDVKAGDVLIATGFTCIPDGGRREVFFNEGQPFISCGDGKHYLDGQLNDAGELVGLERA